MKTLDSTTKNGAAGAFTFAAIEETFAFALSSGYEIITCAEYAKRKRQQTRLGPLTLVNRVDIDFSCRKAAKLGKIFDRLGVSGTFFVRLHAPEYNPFDFENYRCLRGLKASNHEIGFHSEVEDEAMIWKEQAVECLKRDLLVLSAILGIEVRGVASHGANTGFNNLDFWNDHTPSEFGLLYEAYDQSPYFGLFSTSLYVSDSEWTRWKCYRNGVLQREDRRSLREHCMEREPLIYSLVHADTFHDVHFYE